MATALSVTQRRFRILLILAAVQDAALCLLSGVGLLRIDEAATAAAGSANVAAFVVVVGYGMLLLPVSIGLTVWGLIMMRRERAVGRLIDPVSQAAILLAQAPIIVVVLYLILFAIMF